MVRYHRVTTTPKQILVCFSKAYVNNSGNNTSRLKMLTQHEIINQTQMHKVRIEKKKQKKKNEKFNIAEQIRHA